jgi:hypothetical protein
MTQSERCEETAALLPLMAAHGVQADQWMVADLAFVGLHPVLAALPPRSRKATETQPLYTIVGGWNKLRKTWFGDTDT